MQAKQFVELIQATWGKYQSPIMRDLVYGEAMDQEETLDEAYQVLARSYTGYHGNPPSCAEIVKAQATAQELKRANCGALGTGEFWGNMLIEFRTKITPDDDLKIDEIMARTKKRLGMND